MRASVDNRGPDLLVVRSECLFSFIKRQGAKIKSKGRMRTIISAPIPIPYFTKIIAFPAAAIKPPKKIPYRITGTVRATIETLTPSVKPAI